MIHNFFRRLYHALKSQSFVKISDDPYSTHLPFLIGLNKIYGFKRIVEYGSGINSTVAFTNKSIFNFDSIISYENYSEWYEQVKSIIDEIPEVDFRFYDGEMHGAVVDKEVADSDIVFVDDSYSVGSRSRTIKAVRRCNPALCVVHDFENLQYRYSAFSFFHYYRFKSLLPNVGVFGTKLDIEGCKTIDRLVLKGRELLDNNDIVGWSEYFDKHI